MGDDSSTHDASSSNQAADNNNGTTGNDEVDDKSSTSSSESGTSESGKTPEEPTSTADKGLTYNPGSSEVEKTEKDSMEHASSNPSTAGTVESKTGNQSGKGTGTEGPTIGGRTEGTTGASPTQPAVATPPAGTKPAEPVEPGTDKQYHGPKFLRRRYEQRVARATAKNTQTEGNESE